MIHLNNLLDRACLQESFREAWSSICEMKSRLTILNGFWPAKPDLAAEITDLALHRHVLVTAETHPKPEDLARRAITPTHLLTVTEEKDTRLRVTINGQ